MLHPDPDVEFYEHKTQGNVLMQVREVSSNQWKNVPRNSQTLGWLRFCVREDG